MFGLVKWGVVGIAPSFSEEKELCGTTRRWNDEEGLRMWTRRVVEPRRSGARVRGPTRRTAVPTTCSCAELHLCFAVISYLEFYLGTIFNLVVPHLLW